MEVGAVGVPASVNIMRQLVLNGIKMRCNSNKAPLRLPDIDLCEDDFNLDISCSDLTPASPWGSRSRPHPPLSKPICIPKLDLSALATVAHRQKIGSPPAAERKGDQVLIIEQIGQEKNAGTSESAENKLRDAARVGDCARVLTLLVAGTKATADSNGRTALHFAALGGHDEVVRLLLRVSSACGLDAEALTRLGCSALHWAVTKCHASCVHALLSANVGRNSWSRMQGPPLYIAVLQDDVECSGLLLKGGARRALVNPHQEGASCLHVATRKKCIRTAQLLMSPLLPSELAVRGYEQYGGGCGHLEEETFTATTTNQQSTSGVDALSPVKTSIFGESTISTPSHNSKSNCFPNEISSPPSSSSSNSNNQFSRDVLADAELMLFRSLTNASADVSIILACKELFQAAQFADEELSGAMEVALPALFSIRSRSIALQSSCWELCERLLQWDGIPAGQQQQQQSNINSSIIPINSSCANFNNQNALFATNLNQRSQFFFNPAYHSNTFQHNNNNNTNNNNNYFNNNNQVHQELPSSCSSTSMLSASLIYHHQQQHGQQIVRDSSNVKPIVVSSQSFSTMDLNPLKQLFGDRIVLGSQQQSSFTSIYNSINNTGTANNNTNNIIPMNLQQQQQQLLTFQQPILFNSSQNTMSSGNSQNVHHTSYANNNINSLRHEAQHIKTTSSNSLGCTAGSFNNGKLHQHHHHCHNINTMTLMNGMHQIHSSSSTPTTIMTGNSQLYNTNTVSVSTGHLSNNGKPRLILPVGSISSNYNNNNNNANSSINNNTLSSGRPTWRSGSALLSGVDNISLQHNNNNNNTANAHHNYNNHVLGSRQQSLPAASASSRNAFHTFSPIVPSNNNNYTNKSNSVLMTTRSGVFADPHLHHPFDHTANANSSNILGNDNSYTLPHSALHNSNAQNSSKIPDHSSTSVHNRNTLQNSPISRTVSSVSVASSNHNNNITIIASEKNNNNSNASSNANNAMGATGVSLSSPSLPPHKMISFQKSAPLVAVASGLPAQAVAERAAVLFVMQLISFSGVAARRLKMLEHKYSVSSCVNATAEQNCGVLSTSEETFENSIENSNICICQEQQGDLSAINVSSSAKKHPSNGILKLISFPSLSISKDQEDHSNNNVPENRKSHTSIEENGDRSDDYQSLQNGCCTTSLSPNSQGVTEITHVDHILMNNERLSMDTNETKHPFDHQIHFEQLCAPHHVCNDDSQVRRSSQDCPSVSDDSSPSGKPFSRDASRIDVIHRSSYGGNHLQDNDDEDETTTKHITSCSSLSLQSNINNNNNNIKPLSLPFFPFTDSSSISKEESNTNCCDDQEDTDNKVCIFKSSSTASSSALSTSSQFLSKVVAHVSLSSAAASFAKKAFINIFSLWTGYKTSSIPSVAISDACSVIAESRSDQEKLVDFVQKEDFPPSFLIHDTTKSADHNNNNQQQQHQHSCHNASQTHNFTSFSVPLNQKQGNYSAMSFPPHLIPGYKTIKSSSVFNTNSTPSTSASVCSSIQMKPQSSPLSNIKPIIYEEKHISQFAVLYGKSRDLTDLLQDPLEMLHASLIILMDVEKTFQEYITQQYKLLEQSSSPNGKISTGNSMKIYGDQSSVLSSAATSARFSGSMHEDKVWFSWLGVVSNIISHYVFQLDARYDRLIRTIVLNGQHQ